LPGEHRKLTMEADAPTDADIDGVFTTLVSEVHDTSALGRKRPPFDPGYLT
jgi:hypothetical protein